ncbi:MAG TPA: hypothetical protein VFC67_04240 [Prolixibacteraceae bacterium]|nr:hypothetical protein [Prolixibacteraceae bacterium]
MNSNKRSNQQNVDNMEVFTEKAITFEPAFNPSDARLSIQNQKQVKVSGDKALLGVALAERACEDIATTRNIAFDALDPFVTRLVNAVRISDAPAQTIEHGDSIVREYRNQRATEIVPPAKTAEGSDEEESARTNKMRNSSFNTKIENYRNLVLLVNAIVGYKTNETDLTVEAISERLDDLKRVNSACITAEAELEAARKLRDIVLYGAKTGLVDVAMDSKLYVKSAYGATSTQYKSISGITFRKKK